MPGIDLGDAWADNVWECGVWADGVWAGQETQESAGCAGAGDEYVGSGGPGSQTGGQIAGWRGSRTSRRR